jgi:DNA-directed RNA polymerase subunit RPC12/RpoP
MTTPDIFFVKYFFCECGWEGGMGDVNEDGSVECPDCGNQIVKPSYEED